MSLKSTESIEEDCLYGRVWFENWPRTHQVSPLHERYAYNEKLKESQCFFSHTNTWQQNAFKSQNNISTGSGFVNCDDYKAVRRTMELTLLYSNWNSKQTSTARSQYDRFPHSSFFIGLNCLWSTVESVAALNVSSGNTLLKLVSHSESKQRCGGGEASWRTSSISHGYNNGYILGNDGVRP